MESERPEHLARRIPERAASGRPVPRLTSESQVEAMISLLSDSSESVVESCRRALRGHPELAEPLLRDRLARTQGEEHTGAYAALLDVVGARHEPAVIAHLRHSPELEQGSLLIGQMLDASVPAASVKAALDALADQVSAELAQPRDPGRQVSALVEVLGRQSAFLGVESDRADTLDATLHGVILRQRGLPLPLCITWVLVARRLEIPLRGLNMPGHFLVRFAPETLPVPPGEARDVAAEGYLQILDPCHRGRSVTPQDCRRLLSSAGHAEVDPRVLDASDRDMLLRTLRNLVMIASRRRDRDLAARCARILSVVDPDTVRSRKRTP